MPVDREAARSAVHTFLRALGHCPDDNPELARTPDRVVEAFENDLLSGYGVDIEGLLHDGLAPNAAGANAPLVLIRDLDVATVCPHHLLPAIGTAAIAYRPTDQVIGIGTVARLVDAYARRLTLQEAIGQNVVDALCEHVRAAGALCRLELTHTCLVARGARHSRGRVVTVATAGKAPDATELGAALGAPWPR